MTFVPLIERKKAVKVFHRLADSVLVVGAIAIRPWDVGEVFSVVGNDGLCLVSPPCNVVMLERTLGTNNLE